MALAKMQKIRIIGHDTVRDQITDILHEMGVLHIVEVEIEGLERKNVKTKEIEDTLGEVQHALEFIERTTEEKKGFIEGFTRESITEEELRKIADEYDHRPTCKKARSLDTELSRIRSELTRNEGLLEEVLPWAELDIPFEEMKPTKLTILIPGRVPQGEFPSFQEAILGLEAVVLRQAGEREGKTYFYVIVPKDSVDEFHHLTGGFSFERVPLPKDLRGLPKEVIKKLRSRSRDLEEKREEIIQGAEELSNHRRKLQILYQYYHNELLKRSVRLNGSKNTFVLEGWVRARDFSSLKKATGEVTEAFITPIDPLPDEVPPVALENKKPFRPAEMLINLFGLPHPGRLDPTPYVAPFFIIFFGLAVSDAGVGLFILLLSLLIKRKFKGEGTQKLANLVIAGSVVAIITGALTGSFWGPQMLDYIPALKAIMIFDPIGPKGIMIFLGLALILGYFHILLGNVLRWVDLARLGRFWDGLWAQGSWILLLLGLGLVAGIGVPPMVGLSGIPQSLSPVANKLMPIGILAVVVLMGSKEGTTPKKQLPWLLLLGGLILWIVGLPLLVGGAVALAGVAWIVVGEGPFALLKRIGAGAYKVYGISGLLGDVLSYARIMALGISTGVFGMASNVLAQLLGTQFGILGFLLVPFILIVFHTLNLAMSTLSAFVHSTRLQFVEFFTKFYEAGGERFSPFKRETVFYDVKSKE
jgi:V/A-type H+-transporting ATPase subunit I